MVSIHHIICIRGRVLNGWERGFLTRTTPETWLYHLLTLGHQINNVSSQCLCSHLHHELIIVPAPQDSCKKVREHRPRARTVPGTQYWWAVIVPAFVHRCLATALGDSQCYLDFTETCAGLHILQERMSNSNAGLSESQALLFFLSCRLLLVVSLSLHLPFGERRGWVSWCYGSSQHPCISKQQQQRQTNKQTNHDQMFSVPLNAVSLATWLEAFCI